MSQVFNYDIKSLMELNTPTTLNRGIVSEQETGTKSGKNPQTRYWSSIVLLLYIVKYLQQWLSNVVCYLWNCIYEANVTHHKALTYAIKYITDKNNYRFPMKPEGNLNLVWIIYVYSDMD